MVDRQIEGAHVLVPELLAHKRHGPVARIRHHRERKPQRVAELGLAGRELRIDGLAQPLVGVHCGHEGPPLAEVVAPLPGGGDKPSLGAVHPLDEPPRELDVPCADRDRP